MTREEEIKKAAKDIAQGIEDWELAADIEDAFIEGAWWADAHNEGLNMHIKYLKEELIDNACEWLKDYAHMFVSETTGDLYEDDLINDFRKAMEGGEE